ncbi:MFS transporter, partial [Paraburkholderia sp. BCC1884]|uniref:MFS transporter n=1 Tax=Paraburkholderia sp. BCC1884 TaxID=2562668 RepID=UPI0011825FDD
CRLGLGLSEAPCFPTNSRVVATWFPQKERAMATGTYTVGEYIGLAFLSPVLFALMGAFGWRSLFWVVGAVGILFGLAWLRLYREPRDHPAANAAELAYIAEGGGLIDGEAKANKPGQSKFSWAMAGRMLRKRQLAGICLGQFAGNSTLVFFLTWFPTYLAT